VTVRRLLALAVLFSVPALAAQEQVPIFRSRVELVRVDVAVTGAGRPIEGLTTDNFEVYDNGVRQSLERVLYEPVPLEATLVLDASGSVAGEKLAALVAAAGRFLDGLTPRDRAALVTFSHAVRLRRGLSPPDQISSLLGSLTPAGGSTALHDALFAALALREKNDSRAAVVVFSDGLDNASWLSIEDVVEQAKRTDVIVYVVTFGRERRDRPEPLEKAPGQRLFRLATEATGGRVWTTTAPGELSRAFLAALSDLRSRYVLAYRPEGVHSSGWHTLEVRLKGVRGQVSAREGYVGGEPR
jgi:VWFA-related protein